MTAKVVTGRTRKSRKPGFHWVLMRDRSIGAEMWVEVPDAWSKR